MVITGAMAPRDAVQEVQRRLAAAGCEDADFDARELFRLAAGRDARISDRPLSANEAARLEACCVRRESREPLQYICGVWPFLDFELAVGPGVLCPRSDTEVVAEAAAKLICALPAPRVLDLCAGTGCLGLGVKSLCPAAKVICVEKSAEAYVYLEKNASFALRGGRLKGAESALEPSAFAEGMARLPSGSAPPPAVQPVQGDVFDFWRTQQSGSFDLIVSNPPYLTAAEMRALQPEVAREPAMALAAGEDGLDFYRVIATKYKELLKPRGALALEIGWQQRQAVTELLAAAGWQSIECRQDYAGRDRCIIARRDGQDQKA